MLRSIKIVKDYNLIFEKNFGKSLSLDQFQMLMKLMVNDISRPIFTEKDILKRYFYKYQIFLKCDSTKRILFIFITDLEEDNKFIIEELTRFTNTFLNKICANDANSKNSQDILSQFLKSIDNAFKRLWPKISFIGYSGVGKTTIRKLLQEEPIPKEHIPTVSGEICSLVDEKSGDFCRIWDYAGQETYQNLWSNFLIGSDLVLVITDSTNENCQKSLNIIDLIKKKSLDSNVLVIANKQDRKNALPIQEIKRIFGGMDIFPFIATDPTNKKKLTDLIFKMIEIDNKALLVPQVTFNESSLEGACSLDELDHPPVIDNFISDDNQKWVVASNLIQAPEFFQTLEKWIYESWDILIWILDYAKKREPPKEWVLSKEWLMSKPDYQNNKGEFEIVWNQLIKSPFITQKEGELRVNKTGKEFLEMLSKNMFAQFGTRIR
jgi:GTPase SAR1 family protein